MNQNSNPTILFAEEGYRIQGAIFEVYRVMGCGFLESVYQECLQHEFQSRGIPFRAKSTLTLHYKEIVLEQTFQPDFVCYDKIIVELKAVREFAPEHSAQVLNYLKATDLRLGLLVNFGSYPKAIVKRLAN